MIEIDIDSSPVTDALARMATRLTDRRAPLAAIAGVMADAVEENFARQGRPKWLGIKPSPRRAGGKILQDSGQLAASITSASDNDSAVVGTNKVYAAIHQFGGKTRPHVIRPRYKRALAFGGRVVKSVNHPGSNIPARPFLSMTADDEREVVAVVSDYLRGVTGAQA